jgi:hypothetical protein
LSRYWSELPTSENVLDNLVPRVVRAPMMATASRLSRGQNNRALKALAEGGYVKDSGRGLWTAAPKPTKPAGDFDAPDDE